MNFAAMGKNEEMNIDNRIRNYAVCAGGLAQTMEKLANDTQICDNTALRRIVRTVATLSWKVFNVILSKVNPDKLKSIENFTNNCEPKFVPALSPEAKRELTVVDKNDLLKLTEAACGVCLKEGHEVKKCETRRLLERCGVIGKIETGDCPFKFV